MSDRISVIDIRAGKLPGKVSAMSVQAGATVKDVADAAEPRLDTSKEMRLNGAVCELTTEVQNGDTVLQTAKAKGNAA